MGATDYAIDANNGGRLYVWYTVAGGSEPSTYSWTLGTSQLGAGGIARVALADTASPLSGTATKASPASSTTQTSPAVTTLHDDCLVLRFLGLDRALLTVTVPAAHSQKFSVATSASVGARCVLAVASQESAGDAGTANFTLSSARPAALITLAIKPAV